MSDSFFGGFMAYKVFMHSTGFDMDLQVIYSILSNQFYLILVESYQLQLAAVTSDASV